MPVTMFQILWLQVFPARLKPIAWVGLLISLFLIFVAPCECPQGAGFFADVSREQLLVACAGLRGAVPITLATFPLAAGIKKADMIFHLGFFILLRRIPRSFGPS
jgi:cell volume regulation protein A